MKIGRPVPRIEKFHGTEPGEGQKVEGPGTAMAEPGRIVISADLQCSVH